jgi:phage-related protein
MNEEQRLQFNNEFDILIQRTRWIRRSIGLITTAALCICVSITSLFVEVKLGLNAPDFVTLSFIAAMMSLILGLLCFLREIALASRELLFMNLHDGK